MRRAIGIAFAVLAAAAALGGAPAPAMAQDYEMCFAEDGVTPVSGRCINLQRDCVGGVCVEGLWENLAAAQQAVENVRQDIDDLVPPVNVFQLLEDLQDAVPDRVCTPSLLSGPVCVSP